MDGTEAAPSGSQEPQRNHRNAVGPAEGVGARGQDNEVGHAFPEFLFQPAEVADIPVGDDGSEFHLYPHDATVTSLDHQVDLVFTALRAQMTCGGFCALRHHADAERRK